MRLTKLPSTHATGQLVTEPIGDRQQLVGFLHGLDMQVSLLVHGLVAASGVVQELLLRSLELTHLNQLRGPESTCVCFITH